MDDQTDEPAAESSRVEVRLHLAEGRSLDTEDGGSIMLGPGPVDLDLELFFAQRDEEEAIDVAGAYLGIRDASGRPWVAEAAYSGWFFGERMLERVAAARARFEEAAPSSWRRAFAERPLLSGIRDLWDDRTYYTLDLGERRLEIRSKYQGPTLDLALRASAADPRLVVRVSDLYDSSVDEVAPFLFTVPCACLLGSDDSGTPPVFGPEDDAAGRAGLPAAAATSVPALTAVDQELMTAAFAGDAEAVRAAPTPATAGARRR